MAGLEKTMPTPEAVGVSIRDSIDNQERAEVLPHEDVIVDLFSPLPPLEGVPEEPMPLTIRALVVGIVLGSLVNASNVYLGLNMGFTFGAFMMGAVFGFGAIKILQKIAPGVPFLGLEQTRGRILTLTLVCSTFGLFFAVPLRKFFIINFAFLSIHGAGVTNIAPLTARAKASQLVFGGITSGQGLGIRTAQATNLVAGGIASGAADMSQSLVADFRVGFLLRTPPNLQFWRRALGLLFNV
ncbi:hypothetical protein diail_7249 [Diaporthe ilicicola]|nr:hypothetical protein diail_7249 [Diaporthe ilicicola]